MLLLQWGWGSPFFFFFFFFFNLVKKDFSLPFTFTFSVVYRFLLLTVGVFVSYLKKDEKIK